jgi:NAD(P)-dependent dehydrogenase (short-subunit alcohol dehydrogenase family)
VISLDKEFGIDTVGERVAFDLTRIAEIPALIASLGEVDTLVNNAGVLHCDPIDAIPEAHRSEILAVNLVAPAALIAAVAPGMKARRSGRIVNVSSVSAFTGHPDLWYGITKAGILNLTKSWARTLGPHGILVNAVAPGPTETRMYDQLPQSRRDERVGDAAASGRRTISTLVVEATSLAGSQPEDELADIKSNLRLGIQSIVVDRSFRHALRRMDGRRFSHPAREDSCGPAWYLQAIVAPQPQLGSGRRRRDRRLLGVPLFDLPERSRVPYIRWYSSWQPVSWQIHNTDGVRIRLLGGSEAEARRAKMLTKDEARRIAVNKVTRLPEPLGKAAGGPRDASARQSVVARRRTKARDLNW